MHVGRFTVFAAALLFAVIAMLAVSCSDDDKPTAPIRHWSWAPLGTGMESDVLALTVYSTKLIAGGLCSHRP